MGGLGRGTNWGSEEVGEKKAKTQQIKIGEKKKEHEWRDGRCGRGKEGRQRSGVGDMRSE